MESSRQLEVDETNVLIDEVASHAVSLIGEYVGSAEAPISFNDFGAWYNEGGFRDCPWLELLDLRKWTFEPASTSQLPPPPTNASTDNANDPESVVVSFDFPTSSENPVPLSICITKSDLHLLRSAVTDSTLVEHTPQAIIEVLKSLSGSDGKLSYSVLTKLTHSLFPTAHPSDTRRDLILTHFSLLDPAESGILPYEDIAAGFTLFCGGNKSEKLAAAFELFKEEGDYGLAKRGLWRFLRSFLSALVSVSMVANKRDPDEMYDPVDHSAVWTARQIFDYVEKAGQANPEVVDFEEFAEWYTTGAGFKVAPWLELLDLKKLLGLQYEGEDDGGADDDKEEEDEEGECVPLEEDELEGDTTANIHALMNSGVLFSFPLAESTGPNSTLYLTKHDVEYVRILVSETLLREHEVSSSES